MDLRQQSYPRRDVRRTEIFPANSDRPALRAHLRYTQILFGGRTMKVLLQANALRPSLAALILAFLAQTAIGYAEECSLTKTNNTCTLTIDRRSPLVPPTIQMYPKAVLTVEVKNPYYFERYFMDYQSGHIAFIIYNLVRPAGMAAASSAKPETVNCSPLATRATKLAQLAAASSAARPSPIRSAAMPLPASLARRECRCRAWKPHWNGRPRCSRRWVDASPHEV